MLSFASALPFTSIMHLSFLKVTLFFVKNFDIGFSSDFDVLKSLETKKQNQETSLCGFVCVEHFDKHIHNPKKRLNNQILYAVQDRSTSDVVGLGENQQTGKGIKRTGNGCPKNGFYYFFKFD